MNEREKQTGAEIAAALQVATPALNQLDWSHGLTRDDIQARMPDFPHVLYLRLPASKHFGSAQEVEQMIRVAEARAEDAFAEDEDVAEEREALADGGPPAWGNDPLLSGLTQPSGSATDTEGLDASGDGNSALENER